MTYTTVSGDMWDDIAFRVLGSETYKDLLMRENTAHRDTYVFRAGVVLNVPEVDRTAADDTLPPWRKVVG